MSSYLSFKVRKIRLSVQRPLPTTLFEADRLQIHFPLNVFQVGFAGLGFGQIHPGRKVTVFGLFKFFTQEQKDTMHAVRRTNSSLHPLLLSECVASLRLQPQLETFKFKPTILKTPERYMSRPNRTRSESLIVCLYRSGPAAL